MFKRSMGVIGQKVTFSKEIEKLIVISDLENIGVHEGLNGERLDALSYSSLVSMLAVRQVVRA